MHKKIRELLGLAHGEKRKKDTHVELLMGISKDEIVRMKENRVRWVTNVFPLVELDMSRQDCKDWFANRYDRVLPRSACIYCPYKTNKEWLQLKTDYPDDWVKAVEFDKNI